MDKSRKLLIDAHQEWLGFVRPLGLVVAPSVLVDRQAIVDRNVRPRHGAFLELLEGEGENARVRDPRAVLTGFLGWREEDLVGGDDLPEQFDRVLPELGVRLSADYAVPELDPLPDGPLFQMLVKLEPTGTDLDAILENAADGWHASASARFDRLLREAELPIGVLLTDRFARLIYAPRGETSGHLTFRFAEMATVAGRPILAAFEMLLSDQRLFTLPREARLPALLAESRKNQAEVSKRLGEQVQDALYELLHGFNTASSRAADPIALADLARRDPEHLYGGLVACMMRLVFVLYAEDRGLMPDHEVYAQHYGLGGLFECLRADAALNPDTMDARFGAYAGLLSLWRLIHRGGGHGSLRFTGRRGRLFDPDVYPFLEGRGENQDGTLPLVPDGTIWRVLEKLMVLDGERLSYLALDVEQIGSVYERIMGFTVRVLPGHAVAVLPKKSKARGGASAILDLDALLEVKPGDRKKALGEATDQDLTGAAEATLKEATNREDMVAALGRKLDAAITPSPLPPGTPILVPTDERRRTGSHYTPRSLTSPIVSETLRPILERLGPMATPAQILDLKVLDPAMGSGAFLVEACRQLAEALVKAWEAHKAMPNLPSDEDALTHARRLVAGRCLYGVDRNPMAAELGKLSLWLATLAAGHEFTFLDHAVRAGDSLVGLDLDQIEALHWVPKTSDAQLYLMHRLVRDRLARAEAERACIRAAVEEATEDDLRPMLRRAQEQLDDPKRIGDAVIAAFFSCDKSKSRDKAAADVRMAVEGDSLGWRDKLRPTVERLRSGAHPVLPFHWPLEFPEVFDRDNGGFDAIVGNPPFAGKNSIINSNRDGYPDWLKTLHAGAHGNSDLVAHFFRRAFGLLREGGCFGLIATNTIRQGDTRATGLRPIRQAGGTIYSAIRRRKWPGEAAVVVCVVHVVRGELADPHRLDGREVERITAFLFHDGGDDDPEVLEANANKSFQGSIVLGMGFTFDDTDTKGVASPVATMQELIASEPLNGERIFPYIGGEEVNDSPTHAHHRYVINFEDFPLRREDLGVRWNEAAERERRDWLRRGVVPVDYPEPVAADWPDLLAIVEERVRPERLELGENADARRRKKFWWLWGRYTPGLYRAIAPLDRVLALSRLGDKMGFAFLTCGMVYSERLVVLALSSDNSFAVLQSRVHEIWARMFGSSLKDDFMYAPSDCFETFPFPEGFETDPRLEAAGKFYYEFCAELMVDHNEGLTKTYNRFHDPDERSNAIGELRRLHDAMDRAVLDAYGWMDIQPVAVFELEWEGEDEEEGSRRRKKPWRYRWPEEVRDEILARLLALNKQRAEQERLTLGDRQEALTDAGRHALDPKPVRQERPPRGALVSAPLRLAARAAMGAALG